MNEINKKLTIELKQELFPENLILSGFRGSISHGTHIDSSNPDSIDDIDLMAIFLFPTDIYLGLKQPKETVERFIREWDVVSYEFKKFVRMLLNSNPNVMSMLFLSPEHYVDVHPYGKILIDNKELFISKKAYTAYKGYAKGQLLRMNSTNKYLGYMGSKRKKLVDTFGYDTKMASHTIRLLRMIEEFLISGEMKVYRDDDREELIDIKIGKWSKDEVKDEAKRLFNLTDEAYIRSSLPSEPDYDKINIIVKDILSDYICGGDGYAI